jgi:ABC-type phosphate transport system substrate-binding protein
VAAVIAGVGAVISTVQVLRPRWRRQIGYRVHLDNPVGVHADIARAGIGDLAELVLLLKTTQASDAEPLAVEVSNDAGLKLTGEVPDERPMVVRVGTSAIVDSAHEVPDAHVAVIRVSNDGGLDIAEDDYLLPVTFTFGNRWVTGVEVKDATDAQREILLGPGGLTFSANQLNVPPIRLKKKDRFRLLVLLSGSDRTVEATGRLKGAAKDGGVVRSGSGAGPNGATVRAGGFGLTAIGCLAAVVVLLLVHLHTTSPASPTDCVGGSLTAYGSTAFTPAMQAAAAQYQKDCTSSAIAVAPGGIPTGSRNGVRYLSAQGTSDPSAQASQLAMSDGPTDGYPQLHAHPVAVIIFSIVVNKAVGIHSLTTDQLRQIYSGKVTDWRQLGGPDLPIHIVSRGADSGTRATFQQKLLGGVPEPAVSSQNCVDRTPDQQSSPVIRCEAGSTDDLLTQVDVNQGAIGYAEMASTVGAPPTKYPNVDQVLIDGHGPDPLTVRNDQYPFWAVEEIYTYGEPAGDSLSAAFLRYLSQDAAKTLLQDRGYIPCTDPQGDPIQLCQ